MVCDPNAAWFIGAEADTNGVAELQASTRASLWMLQSGFSAFTYRYDAKYANAMADACAMPKKNIRLVELAASLRKLLQTRSSVVDAVHRPAHSGDPWNELVDGACDSVSRRHMGFAEASMPNWLRDLCDGKLGIIGWLHLHAESDVFREAFPPVDDQGRFDLWSGVKHGLFAIDDQSIAANIDADPGSVSNSTVEGNDDGILVTSMNVLSLRGDIKLAAGSQPRQDRGGGGRTKQAVGDDFMNAASKLALVTGQLATRRVHVAGLQEMRPYKTGISKCDGFFICKSQADGRGGHGCGILLNSKTPWYVKGQQVVFITRDGISIEYASPRLLCVGICLPDMEAVCVSCHGPLSTSTDCILLEYCEFAAAWIMQNARVRNVILCMDANATLHREAEEQVGHVLSPAANDAYDAFYRFLELTGTWIPSTFDAFAELPVSTSFPNSKCVRAVGKRIDFVGGGSTVGAIERSAEVWEDFQMPHKHRDHLPAAVNITVKLKARTMHFKRRTAMYNRRATNDPAKCAHFRDMIAHIPSPRFRVEPTSHTFMLDQAINQAAVAAFGEPEKAMPRQSYVNANTLQLIKARKKAMRQAAYAGRLIRLATAKEVFARWSGSSKRKSRHCVFGFVRSWVFEQRLRQSAAAGSLHGRVATEIRTTYAAAVEAKVIALTMDVNEDDPEFEELAIMPVNAMQQRYAAIRDILQFNCIMATFCRMHKAINR